MKNNLLVIAVLLTTLVGCNLKDVPTKPITTNNLKTKSIINYFQHDKNTYEIPKIVKINSKTRLLFIPENISPVNVIAKSKLGLNKIIKEGSKYYLKTENDIGITTIIFPVNKNKNDSLHIFVYKQFVILKADDMIFQEKLISKRWLKFIKYCVENNIKASIGIIGNSLEKGNTDYYDYLKLVHKSNFIEFWNHGYTHVLGVKDSTGKVYSEFRDSGYEYQKTALEKTQNLCKKYLGFYPAAFGAPGNAIDNTTTKVIDENSEIKIWFFGKKETKKFLIKRLAEIEFPYGHPIYEKFINNYLCDEKLLTFQIHPNMWDDEKFIVFNKIIEYLEAKNVTFLTPSEYYFLSTSK